jgi:biopolymer transport protein ExbB
MEFMAMLAPIQFLINGGWFMVPLVLCSITAVTFIIERGLALRREKVISDEIAQGIDQLCPGGDATDLAERCHQDGTMLGRLAHVAFEHAPYSKEESSEAIQAKGRHEAALLERGLVILEIIAYIAPLLGLLGTVSGMARLFAQIGLQNITQQQDEFARGISEILNATMTGLTIAIPAYMAYSYYARKVETMVIEVETICADLLAKLYRQPAEPAVSSHKKKVGP